MKEYLFYKAGNGKITVTLHDNHIEVKHRGMMNKMAGGTDAEINYQDLIESKWRNPGLITIGRLEIIGKFSDIVYNFAKREIEMAKEVKQFIDEKIARNMERNAEETVVCANNAVE